MDTEDKKSIKAVVLEHMVGMMDTDQARNITDIIIDDVVKDVEECADGENWNDSDVRLAIGRVLIQRLSPSERKVYVTAYTTHSGHDDELDTDVYINPTKERAEEAMRLCIGDIAETECDDVCEQDRLGKEIYESALPCRPDLNQGRLKEVRYAGHDGNNYMVKIEQRIIKED